MNILWRHSFIICIIMSSFSMAYANNLLFIGDSHTASSYAFGGEVHKLLSNSNKFENIVTLGHSSSAAIHWVNEKEYMLSGGINHQFKNKHNQQFIHPSLPHWTKKSKVPKLENVLENMIVHASWGRRVPITPDIVVIALGANDARAISNSQGVINRSAFDLRKNKIKSMLDQVERVRARCIWIGPPMGESKTKANQKALYKFLKSSINNRCSFMSSNHFIALKSGKYCDGIHLSCPTERNKARLWAAETVDFILKEL